MSEDNPIPQFGPEARRALFHERVLVLDGALDDDNGTLLMTQLLTLSAPELTVLVGYYATLALQLRVFRVEA
jgi:ATP-dependent Clp protease protease subunit